MTDLDNYDGPLLLDTHIWIWHLTGDATHLSTSVVSLLDRVGRTSGLRVSDVSYWEVAVKAAKKKLTLSLDAAIWLQRAERAPGIRFLPLERDKLIIDYARSVPGTPVVDVRM